MRRHVPFDRPRQKMKEFVKIRKLNFNFLYLFSIILLVFFVLPTTVYGYGKTHAYITIEAFNIWPRDCSSVAFQEFCNHRYPNPDDPDPYQKYAYKSFVNHCDYSEGWCQIPSPTSGCMLFVNEKGCIGDPYSGNTILEGDVEEDEGRRGIVNVSGYDILKEDDLKEWVDHFWDPITNATMNKTDEIFDLIPNSFVDYSMTAFEKAAFMFTLAYFYNKGSLSPPFGINGKDLSYYYMGRTAHLLQDMAVPAHVNQDVHAIQGDTLWNLEFGDRYESWTKQNVYTGTSLHFDRLDPIDINSNELVYLPLACYLYDVEPKEALYGFFNEIERKLLNFWFLPYVKDDQQARDNVTRLANLANQIKNIINSSNDTEKENLSKLLKHVKKLFYNLARAAQYFPSRDSYTWDNDDTDSTDGRLHSNLSYPYPPFTNGWDNIKWYELWSWRPHYYHKGLWVPVPSCPEFKTYNECQQNYPSNENECRIVEKQAEDRINKIASYLIPRAIQFTASLYELFYNAVDARPTITEDLRITNPSSGPFYVNQTLHAEFTITNKGEKPITFDEIFISGRFGNDTFSGGCPTSNNVCPEFSPRPSKTLAPGESYPYKGTFVLTQTGDYKFTPVYKQGTIWNTDIPAELDITKILNINVGPTPQPPTTPYNNAKLIQHITYPFGSTVSPNQRFIKTWRIENAGNTSWGSGYKLVFYPMTGSYSQWSFVPVSLSQNVVPGNTIDISVDLIAPSSLGLYYGVWVLQDPNGKPFPDILPVVIIVRTSTTGLSVGDWIQVTGTNGLGLNVRACAKLSCAETCSTNVYDGDAGKIIEGPQYYDGYTWWRIQWDSGNTYCIGITGWSAEDTITEPWLTRILYPTEGQLIKAKGTASKYLLKDGKKWLIRNDDIFTKMGYNFSSVRDLPLDLINSLSSGPIIVDNGTLIRQQGDTKVYRIENNQRRLFTSTEAFVKKGYSWEDVIDVTSAIMSMYPQGPDITVRPNVLAVSPNGGESSIIGNQYSIVWSATDDLGVSSISLYYSTDGGSSWYSIITGLTNTGYYLWTPNFTSPAVKIKVVAYDTSGVSGEDRSDGNFSIQDIYRYADLTISSLNLSTNQVIAGQQITVTTTILNQGNGTSNSTNVKYYFSTTSTGKDIYLGESNVPSLGAGTPTTLNATVTIPSTNALQGYIVAVVNPDYLISESTTGNNTASSPISIVDNEPPIIHSLSFGSYSFYKTGYEYPIVFNVTDNKGVAFLEFYYSTDNGINWNTITNYFIPGSNGCQNCYYWTIPTTITPPASLLIKMVAKDASGNPAVATAGPYEVKDGTKPFVTILSPNGGEIWDLGSTQTVKWSVNVPNGINGIWLSLYWGDKVESIATIKSNTDSYSWTLPTSSEYVSTTARIKIRVEDLNYNINEDWSDNYFTIRDNSIPPPAPWTTPHVITSLNETPLSYPSALAVQTDSSGNLHMAYKDVQTSAGSSGRTIVTQQIRYRKLVDSTWSSPMTVYAVTQETDGSDYIRLEDLNIAIDSLDKPHVIWKTNFGSIPNINQNDIYYAYYDGSTWSTPFNLSSDISNVNVSEMPRIIIDPSNNVHVVWRDGYSRNADFTINGEPNIYYRKKHNNGIWSSVLKLTNGGSSSPAIASDRNDNLYMAYQFDPFSLAYIKWDGTTWSTPVIVSTSAEGYVNLVADSNNNLHMVWYYFDSSTKTHQILYSYYDGTSWTTPEKISELLDGLYRPNYPSIVVDSLNRPHVIYEETHNGKLVYRYKDTDGWSTPVQLNLSSQYVKNNSSDIAISPDDTIHIVWTSYYSGSTAIFYNYANVSGSINDITSPSISVISPSTGDSLSIGSIYNILWTATDNIGVSSISLEYTTDGGINYNPVATNAVNNGVYQWTVPNITSSNVHLRITALDVAGNSGTGLSGVFSISDLTAPFVVVTAPNGGEVFETGSQQTMQWIASDNVGIKTIDFHYSTDGGMSWNLIASGLSGISYSWTVPPQKTSDCRVKVVTLDAVGNVGQDISDGSFTIVSANKPPNQPNNPNPGDGASGISISQILTWDGGDPDADDTVTYDVYFGTSSTPPLISSYQTETYFNPGTLYPNAVYYWKIVSKDSRGDSSISPLWYFVTGYDNTQPSADPNGPYSGTEGQAITLDGSGSSDTDGIIVLYEWDVDNDGNYEYISATPTQNHTYAQDGTYTVKLRVTDNLGATDETSTIANISDTSPTADFSGNPTSGIALLTVNFTNNSTGYDQLLSYNWGFGDGETSTEENPTHTYVSAGTYSVSLTVTDSDGSTDTLIKEVLLQFSC